MFGNCYHREGYSLVSSRCEWGSGHARLFIWSVTEQTRISRVRTYKQHLWKVVVQNFGFDCLERGQIDCSSKNRRHFVLEDPWQCRYVLDNRSNPGDVCTCFGSLCRLLSVWIRPSVQYVMRHGTSVPTEWFLWRLIFHRAVYLELVRLCRMFPGQAVLSLGLVHVSGFNVLVGSKTYTYRSGQSREQQCNARLRRRLCCSSYMNSAFCQPWSTTS